MKLRLSLMAALAVFSANAFALELYEDSTTKQIYTTPGEGRVKLGSFVQEGSASNMASEAKVTTNAVKIDFSGLDYFGFTDMNARKQNFYGSSTQDGFEVRRAYFTAKAYLGTKDYFRMTLDATKELQPKQSTSGEPGLAGGVGAPSGGSGAANFYIKYAYLWLDNILPYTGVEIGVAHTTVIDYLENSTWFWRSIERTINEDTFSQNFASTTKAQTTGTLYNVGVSGSSADLGVNFRTVSPYVTSEVGVFNGEYNAGGTNMNTTGLDLEGRITACAFGNGKSGYNPKKDEYLNFTVAGIYNMGKNQTSQIPGAVTSQNSKNLSVYAVYNQPMFLLAAEAGRTFNSAGNYYVGNPSVSNTQNWASVNGDFRFMDKWDIIARYDYLSAKYLAGNNTNNMNKVGNGTQAIYGVAYDYSKYVKFIASAKTVWVPDSRATYGYNSSTSYASIGQTLSTQNWMLTTQVQW